MKYVRPIATAAAIVATHILAAHLGCHCSAFAQESSTAPTDAAPQQIGSNDEQESSTQVTAPATTHVARNDTDRLASNSRTRTTDRPEPHPLDRALEIAEDGLERIRTEIRDYKAIMVKRERIRGELSDQEWMVVKIRNRRDAANDPTPFSIYMKYLRPSSVKGRELIYVEGENQNKILAHEGRGVGSLLTLKLDPDGSMAMQNARHPIYKAGIENLVKELLEKGCRDRDAGMCEVKYIEETAINKRPCSMIQVKHNEKCEPYEYYVAQIFIDKELQIPVRFVAYDWPKAPGERPQLLEEYTYIDVELNVGLTDDDFNPDNDEYHYR